MFQTTRMIIYILYAACDSFTDLPGRFSRPANLFELIGKVVQV